MENKKGKLYKRFRWMWLAGFLGISGLQYLVTGNPEKLFYLAFFSYFAFYFVYRIVRQKEDERMRENHRRAISLAQRVPLAAIAIIGIVPTYTPVDQLFFLIVATIALFIYVITYVISFYYFEKYT